MATSTTAYPGKPATIAEAEADCREFYCEFGHLPNVDKAVRLAEAGTLSWFEVHAVFYRALNTGLEAVR